MKPDELIDVLARLVADGDLTEEQAAALLLALRDGSLTDEMLPLPPYLRSYQAEKEDEKVRLILALLSGGLLAWLKRSGAQRIDGADLLQDWFGGEAQVLARNVASGRISVAEFQRRLGEMTRQHALAQGYLGSRDYGRMIGDIDAMMQRQSAYIQRFADQLSLRRLNSAAGGAVAVPEWSAEYLAQRINLYSGTGRSIFFEALDEYGDENGAGWVVEYVAVDDGGTCFPCSSAQGFYLPGAGPYPGEVCLGGGNCRCRRVPEYNPEMYRQLGGI